LFGERLVDSAGGIVQLRYEALDGELQRHSLLRKADDHRGQYPILEHDGHGYGDLVRYTARVHGARIAAGTCLFQNLVDLRPVLRQLVDFVRRAAQDLEERLALLGRAEGEVDSTYRGHEQRQACACGDTL